MPGAGDTAGAATWRVAVDRGLCIGSGACRGTMPGLFTDAGDGTTTVTGETAPQDERILDAAETCPVEAISVTDATTGQPVWPPPD